MERRRTRGGMREDEKFKREKMESGERKRRASVEFGEELYGVRRERERENCDL